MIEAPIQRWLREHALIEPSLLSGPGVELIIAQRLAAFGGSESAYIAELARSSDELDRLIAGIAVPETWLFRYPRSFELLADVLSRLFAAGSPKLRMLSIGCATGQEPYCMAMTAAHVGWPVERVDIQAIDRNRDWLRLAASGSYGASSIRTELPPWSIQFLDRSGDTVAVDPSIRAMVHFRRADVTLPATLRGEGPFDVIFCRNVLIYLNAQAREQLLDSVCAELSPGGVLFVGHAEQVLRGSMPLRYIDFPHAFALEQFTGPPVNLLPPESPALRGRAAAQPVPRRIAPHANGATQPVRLAPAASEKSADISIETARELADVGRASEAQTMIRAILARHGPSAAVLELQGMICLSLSDRDGARRHFEQSLYLDPLRPAALLQLALICEKAGDTVHAAAYWSRARRASPAGEKDVSP